MSQKNEIQTLNKILAEMTFYSNPDLLIEKAREGINFDSIDKDKIKKYQTLLVNIKWALDKVLKYPVYFEEFYPKSDKIQKHEALEHHVHSYIEDLNILRNKIHVFLGTLKNDLKKIAINKEEIDSALKFLEGQVYKVFKNVSDTRNPHNHKGNRFKDGDLVDVEFVRVQLADNFPLKSQFKPEFLKELKQREEASFKKAQERWIKMATNNSKQTSGLVEDVFNRNKGFLYQLLKIKTIPIPKSL